MVKKTALIDPKLTDWEDATDSNHPFHSDVVIKWSQLKIESKLGNGAFGEVKKAHYRGTPVAVKMLHIGDAAQAFFQEATLLCSLRHPNIVACLGVCVIEPNLAIVMELMASNLTLIIREGAIPTLKLVELAIGITRGILFLHNREPKVIHRDIKPENILIDSGGIPKLADFGVSKESLETMTQTKIGTPIYAAPELLNGDAYGTAIDIYSLSMVFYAMATGVTPFTDLKSGSRPHTPAQIMMKTAVKRERPIIPASVNTSVAAIIRDCWDHFPKKRPTAEQLLERLVNLHQELLSKVKPEAVKVEVSPSYEPTIPLLASAPTVPITHYQSSITHLDFDWMGDTDSIPLEKRPPAAAPVVAAVASSSVLVPAPMPNNISRNGSHSTSSSTQATATNSLTATMPIIASDAAPSRIYRSGRTLRSESRAAKIAAATAAATGAKVVETSDPGSGATSALASLDVSLESNGSARESRSKSRSRATKKSAAPPSKSNSASSSDTSSFTATTRSINYTSDVPTLDDDLESMIQKASERRFKRKSPTAAELVNEVEDAELSSPSLSQKKLVYQLELEEGKRRSVWS